ncbi:MAG TPA: hypothetical protein VGH20_19890 [Myxococcales bacterium]
MIALLLAAAATAAAATAAAPAAPSATVEAVDIHVGGIGFTSASAIRRFMLTEAGQPFDQDTLDSDLRRLRTLGILYDLDAHRDGDRVQVEAKDRWSLVPFFGLRRGGGRTTARFGVADHNLAGQLATVYAELNSNTDVPFVQGGPYGSFIYAEAPRLFGSGFSAGLYWTRDFIDFTSYGATGNTGFLYDRQRHDLRGELRYELFPLVSAGAGVEVQRDRFGTSDLSRVAGVPPPAADATFGFFNVSFGLVEQFVSQASGNDVKLELEGARHGFLGSTADVVIGSIAARSFSIPRPGHNLVLQMQLQTSNGTSDSFFFHAGGLREIRGFPDAYFEGRTLLRGNAEYRLDVLQTNWLLRAVGQVAAFTDFGYVAGRRGAIAGLDYEGTIVSAGFGGRYIPVAFARAVGRLDLAFGLAPRRTIDISFGGQQFF